MKNNWKEKAKEIAERNIEDCFEIENITRAMLEFGNLVFEATKKECADSAKIKWVKDTDDFYGGYDLDKTNINKESILNIKKPKL